MKIALIAMSGVRACDEDLLELGLTLPGFVERSKTIASLPSLGLLTLAGMTPERHQVTYIEVDDIHQQPDLPDDFDLVAISTFSAQIFEAYELASQFRKKSIPVIMGGLHVTALPEEAGEHCDAVIVGEGEPVWLSVLEDAENNCLKKVYGAFDSPFRLEDSPMPAFHLLDIDKYNRITVQTSRGCPHKCEFCASSILLTSKYKQKPVERVLAEIDAIKSIWNHPFIEFADDNSFVNKRYWKQLLPQLKERKIRWFGETDLSVADDPHILDLMRESGCAQVLIGLESPIDAGMQGIEMKTDWKHRRLPKYKEAIRRIQDHGITVNGCFIIGLDGQSKRIFEDVFNFVQDAELFEVQVTYLTAFPGTPLYERLIRENRILEPGNWRKCTLFDINYQPSDMSVDELREGFYSLVKQLYSDSFTNWRRDQFWKRYKEKRLAGA
jgi:radical SAM superfamily enzyme YgiQ (UPF0313 family)